MRRARCLLLALLLPVAGCATMTAPADPTAGLDNAKVARRVADNGDLIELYRVGGQLRMVKVTPERGPVYYLIDNNGDGLLENSEGEVVPVSWKLFEWN